MRPPWEHRLLALIIRSALASSELTRLEVSILVMQLIIRLVIFLFSKAVSVAAYDVLLKAPCIWMKATRATCLASIAPGQLINCRRSSFAALIGKMVIV